jgi:hypothetical protein
VQILGHAFDAIDVAFIEELVANRIPESITHDYKEQLPHKRDEGARARLLQVITSFANTSGGVLVIGVNAESEEWSIPGLPDLDEDKSVHGIEQLVRSGIEPPLPSVRFQVLRRQAAAPLLLVGVPRSLARPHRTASQYGERFVRRTNRGTDPMTVPELRDAFLEADRWLTEAEEFHRARVQELRIGNGVAFGAAKTAVLILHLIPLGQIRGLQARAELNVTPTMKPLPLINDDWRLRFHFEGRRWLYMGGDGVLPRWFLDYRNGIGEFVMPIGELQPRRTQGGPDSPYGADSIELSIATATAELLRRAHSRGGEFPMALHLSLSLSPGTPLGADFMTTFEPVPPGLPLRSTSQVPAFDRPMIEVPGLALMSPPEHLSAVLRPIMDVIWQAAGQPLSRLYRSDGSWLLQPHFDESVCR